MLVFPKKIKFYLEPIIIFLSIKYKEVIIAKKPIFMREGT